MLYKLPHLRRYDISESADATDAKILRTLQFLIAPNMENFSAYTMTEVTGRGNTVGETFPNFEGNFETTESVFRVTVATDASAIFTGRTLSPSGANEVPFSTYALATSVALLMFLVTVVPNTMIIFLVIMDRKLRRLSNYYIISLAVADCIVGAIVMPCMASYTILGFWALGGIICDLWISVDFMCCTASMLSLCMISLDRYWAITQPLKHIRRRNRKRSTCYVAMIWVISIICWVPAIAAFRIVHGSFGEFDCVYLTDPIYVLLSAVFIYYVPMFAMVFLYVNVYVTVKKQAKALESFEDSDNDKQDNGPNRSSALSTELSTYTSESSEQTRTSVYTNRGFVGSKKSLNECVDAATTPNNIHLDISGSNTNVTSTSDTNTSYLTPTYETPTSISRTLAGNQRTVQVTAERMRQLRLRTMRRKHAAVNRRTARTLGIIVILFLLCWLPFVILFPINAFCECVPGKLYDVSYWLTYVNSTLNPFLYGFSSDFRRAFRRLFCTRCVSVAQDANSSVDDLKLAVPQQNQNRI